MRVFLAVFFFFFSALSQATLADELSLRPLPDPWVAVLMFHQVTDHPIKSAAGVDHLTKPWLSPVEFDRVLSELATDGYHVISLAQAFDVINGQTTDLPSKPVLLTFDDGYRSAWTEATPILQRHHDVATMFFEGHATDNPLIPNRLSRVDLRAMSRSGIWTLQSHGFAGHSDLLISETGTTSPYWYANLAWLPQEHRFETRREFQQRITDDLTRFRRTFEPVVGEPIHAFAYPSGEYGQNASALASEDRTIRIQAGDSNASGLTPYLFAALKNAGFTAAFSVANYGGDHLADSTNDPLAIPRVGVNAHFAVGELAALQTQGRELPEIANGHYADVGPIAPIPGGLIAASTDAPTLFILDSLGRKRMEVSFPTLLADRPGHHSLISGLVATSSTLWLIQQKGSAPGAQPMLSRFALHENSMRLVSRKPLPQAMNWTVGMTEFHSHIIALDGSGTIFDLASGSKIGAIAGTPMGHFSTDPFSRYAGLASTATQLLTYDSSRHCIVAFGSTGMIQTTAQLAAPIHALAVTGSTLFATVWDRQRRTLRRFALEVTP